MWRSEASWRKVRERSPPGCGRVRRRPDAETRRPDRRLRLREQVRELGGELVRAVAAHRVAGDRRHVGVERVVARDVGPDLERVRARAVVVPAVRAAPGRRHHDVPAAAVAELRLVAAARELVVVGAERVQQQLQPVATAGRRLLRHVERVRLQAPEQLARAALRGPALLVEVDALLGLEATGEDPVEHAGARHAALVRGPVGELAEVHVGVERGEVARLQRAALALVAPPGRARGRAGRVAHLRQRLVGAEGGVEERGRPRPAAAGLRRGPRRALGHEVRARGGVPEPDARGQAHGAAARVPGRVRDADLDLAALAVHAHRRRAAGHGLLGDGVEQVGARAVDGEEHRGRRGRVRAVRERQRRRRAADRDRRGDLLGVVHRVQRQPEGGRVRERLHAQLDEVGRVAGVDRVARVGVGAVGAREGVVAGAVVAGVARRPRAVVVVEEVLVEELARAVGGGARDEDRVGSPDARVGELGRGGRAGVEDVRAGARARPAVERGLVGARDARSRHHRHHDRCQTRRLPHRAHPNFL